MHGKLIEAYQRQTKREQQIQIYLTDRVEHLDIVDEMTLNLRVDEFQMMKPKCNPNDSIPWQDYDASIQMQHIVDDALDSFEIHGPYPIQMILLNDGVHAKNQLL